MLADIHSFNLGENVDMMNMFADDPHLKTKSTAISRYPWVRWERGLLGLKLPGFAAKALARFFYVLQEKFGGTVFINCEATTSVVHSYNLTTYWIMVFDRRRMDCYKLALSAGSKDRTVLDVGTGATLPLARFAVDYGAAHVHAIEANDRTLAAARECIKRHDLVGQINLLHGLSTEIDLPNRVDLIVHEIIGTVASSEGAPLFIKDLVDRALVTDGCVVPCGFATRLMPVDTTHRPNPWKRVVSSIVGGCRDYISDRGLQVVCNPNRRTFLTDTPPLIDKWDFSDPSIISNWSLTCDENIEILVSRPGFFSGCLLWPEIYFPDTNEFFDGNAVTNWGSMFVRLFRDAVPVRPGDRIVVRFRVDARTADPKYHIHVELPNGVSSEIKWQGAGHLSTLLAPDEQI